MIKMRDEKSARCLADLVNETGLSSISMVEVGSYAGESAEIFASMPEVNEIWCVDPWLPGYDSSDKASDSDFTDVERSFDKVMSRHPDKIRKFKGSFKEFSNEHKKYVPDLVYIDACHMYEYVKSDIETASSMKAMFISGHDIAFDTVRDAVFDSIGGPTKTFCDTSWIKKRRKNISFTVDDMFENSFVMVKDDGEYDRFCMRMKAAGFGKMPLKYVGMYPKILFCGGNGGVNACALNHFVIVNMARTLDLPCVTIFESDAYPMKNCHDELSAFLDSNGFPEDADLAIYGNLEYIREWGHGRRKDFCIYDVQNGYGIIEKNLWGAHAVVVAKRGYDRWIDSFISQPKQINADFFKWITPYSYATERSFFIQWKDVIQNPQEIVDKENLKDFPENI